MKLEEWKSQIKRGTLEFCVLLLLEQKARYGYELISILEQRPVVAAGESTIYPLLRRLLKDGFLCAFWQDTAEGLPPRKYYSLTEMGKAHLNAMKSEWKTLTETIENIQEGYDEQSSERISGKS